MLVDGESVLSCLALAVQYRDREITTIEGLAENGVLHPLQAAFVEHDGFQCGYCTPGQILSAVGMIDEFRNGMPSAVGAGVAEGDAPDDAPGEAELSEEEIRERMSGNICRCGAYNGIVASVQQTFDGGGAR